MRSAHRSRSANVHEQEATPPSERVGAHQERVETKPQEPRSHHILERPPPSNLYRSPTGVSALSTPPTVCILISPLQSASKSAAAPTLIKATATPHKNTAQTQPQLTALWSEASTHTQSAAHALTLQARTHSPQSPLRRACRLRRRCERAPGIRRAVRSHLSVTIQFLARQPATVARQSATVAEGWLGRR